MAFTSSSISTCLAFQFQLPTYFSKYHILLSHHPICHLLKMTSTLRFPCLSSCCSLRLDWYLSLRLQLTWHFFQEAFLLFLPQPRRITSLCDYQWDCTSIIALTSVCSIAELVTQLDWEPLQRKRQVLLLSVAPMQYLASTGTEKLNEWMHESVATQMNTYPQSTENMKVKGYLLRRYPSQGVYLHKLMISLGEGVPLSYDEDKMQAGPMVEVVQEANGRAQTLTSICQSSLKIGSSHHPQHQFTARSVGGIYKVIFFR